MLIPTSKLSLSSSDVGLKHVPSPQLITTSCHPNVSDWLTVTRKVLLTLLDIHYFPLSVDEFHIKWKTCMISLKWSWLQLIRDLDCIQVHNNIVVKLCWKWEYMNGEYISLLVRQRIPVKIESWPLVSCKVFIKIILRWFFWWARQYLSTYTLSFSYHNVFLQLVHALLVTIHILA